MSRAQLTSTVEQNTGGAVSPYVAGKNAIINGNFDIWQRGTSITTTTAFTYTADRWTHNSNGVSFTVSRQTTGVPAGSQYCLRLAANAGSQTAYVQQVIETANVVPMQGKTVTLSVLLRRNSSFTPGLSITIQKSSGTDTAPSGSWTQIGSAYASNANLPTGTASSNWYSISTTVAVPNDGTANSLMVTIQPDASQASGSYFEVSQMQLEVGSVATPFSRAGGTLSGELAACQRYYYRITPNGVANATIGYGLAASTTNMLMNIAVPVSMRVNPTALDSSGVDIRTGAGGLAGTFSNIYIETSQCGNQQLAITATVTSGLTANTGYYTRTTSSSGYVGFSAEL